MRLPSRLLGLVLLLTLAFPVPASPQARNVYGIQTLVSDSPEDFEKQLTWARTLIGPGGYVTQPFHPIDGTTEGPTPEAVAFVEQAYALGLNPIIRLQGPYSSGSGCDPHQLRAWLRPEPDAGPSADLTYAAEAAAYARFVHGLPRADGRTLFVQVGNEPNLHFMWSGSANPAEYARFFVDVAAAIREIGDDRIKVLNAALAPEGDVDNLQFIETAIQADPRFLTSFDYWASHPYPHNQPPANNLHDGTALPGSRYAIDAYLLEFEVLKRHGLDLSNLQVVLTETGYRLGDAWYPHYPAVDEENRAEYMKQAFERYWPAWPEVLAVTPFALADIDGDWEEFDWVWSKGGVDDNGFPTQPRLQYARLLRGTGIVMGRVVDQTGKPVKDVQLTADANGHRSTTLRDGTFIMIGYPGTYRISAEKRGYQSASAEGVVVTQDGTSHLDLSLVKNPSATVQNPSVESGDMSDWTAWGAVDGVQKGKWFFGITAFDGEHFLGTASNCVEKDGGFYQSVAARPGSTLTVRAQVLTRKEGAADMGSRIGLDPTGGTDPDAPGVIWSPWTHTSSRWKQVKLSAMAEAETATIFLQHDQHLDNPWNVNAFDRVEVEAAEPGQAAMPTEEAE